VRAHYAIALVATILVLFSLKLILLPTPIAEAVVAGSKNLSVEKFYDMTFVFPEREDE
jgi:hypothetical protein